MTYIFVYGTLRKGERNDHFLRNATRVAEQSWTKGKLYDTGFGYPAVKPAKDSFVYGELYEVNDTELAAIDRLEDYKEGGSDNLYDRVQQPIFTDTGEVNALIYIAGNEALLRDEIHSGDWKEYLVLNGQKNVLYFAYGSCMDNARFIEHGVDHYFQKFVGVAILPQYTLRFSIQSSLDRMGRADIVEEGGVVEGKLYDIPVAALKDYLYRREGVPFSYRPAFIRVQVKGKWVENVLTFVVAKKQDETAPPDHYSEEIIRGGTGFLSDGYIEKVKKHINKLR
ncbi:gamma-glutamylcyclotransferase [Bacillus alkalicellulosilyticus]|uniref:gamma-glutamylcyclotransferase n=1 Tax=Alkalihalobacterium alkalicellulosilyticum TaxID=1912214 RepID=UPI000997C790|nr:gamma-glutamylcyclotransferase family protein [Bacillus alkalicellulosilyticus]